MASDGFVAKGYSTNQFLNFESYEGKGASIKRTTQDNPEFAYPGNLIPNIYDSPADVRTPTLVQRGFIRGIFPEVIAAQNAGKDKSYKNAVPPTRRCFFQFNPSLILRSVQASSSTLNPLLQDATQLLQPIPGQASFEFQLLFNREREVSNQAYWTAGYENKARTSNLGSVGDVLATYGSSGVDSNGKAYGQGYSQADVGDLGVLTDLYILDSIIGQSITADMVDTVMAYWQNTTKATKTTTASKTDGTNTETTADNPWAGYQWDEKGADFKKRLGQVLGNTAFLNPLPVRIVFSSLFMVEGFVTASNVAFHKFTKNMIPTVCTVTLNVQALYVGFAKKQSYVSEQLALQLKDVQAKDAETVAIQKTALEALTNYAHVKLNWLNFLSNSSSGYSLNQLYNGEMSTSPLTRSLQLMSRTNDNAVKKGLHIWTDPTLVGKIDAGVQDFKVDKVELMFVNVDKLPPNLTDLRAVEKAAQTGQLNGANGANMGGKNLFSDNDVTFSNYIIDTIEILAGESNATSLSSTSSLDLGKIKEATSDKPLSFKWQSTEFNSYGYPNPVPSGYQPFGNNLALVLVATFSCQVPDSYGNLVAERVVVKKAKAYAIDPDSVSEFEALHTSNGDGDQWTKGIQI